MSNQINTDNSHSVAQNYQGLSKPLKSVFVLAAFLFWLLIMLPVFVVFKLIFPKKISHFYCAFHSGVCRILSIHCHIEGNISVQRPTLFLSNHISYLDVMVLGGFVPAYFIAKSDVAHWPVLGFLSKLQNTLFFERKGQRVKEQLKIMSDHFSQHKNLILFPEGTSTSGEQVEPFKSSLLQSLEMTSLDVAIQPITIAYTHHKKQKMDQGVRDYFAWYGDMPFASHFFSAAGMGGVDVSIIFHAPISLKDFSCRKDCTQYCYEQVSKGLQYALSKNA